MESRLPILWLMLQDGSSDGPSFASWQVLLAFVLIDEPARGHTFGLLDVRVNDF
jgi:hypothetical protein